MCKSIFIADAHCDLTNLYHQDQDWDQSKSLWSYAWSCLLIYRSSRSFPTESLPIVFDLQILTINSQLPFVLLNIKVRDRARSLLLKFPVSGTHLGIDQRHLAGIQNEDDNEQAPQQRQLWTLRRSRLGSRRSHSSVVEVLSVCVCLCFFFLQLFGYIYLGGLGSFTVRIRGVGFLYCVYNVGGAKKKEVTMFMALRELD